MGFRAGCLLGRTGLLSVGQGTRPHLYRTTGTFPSPHVRSSFPYPLFPTRPPPTHVLGPPRYAAALDAARDDDHLLKFEELLEAAVDLQRVPDEYLICPSYDDRLQVRAHQQFETHDCTACHCWYRRTMLPPRGPAIYTVVAISIRSSKFRTGLFNDDRLAGQFKLRKEFSDFWNRR